MKKICIGIATVIVFMFMVYGSAIAQSILSSISGTVTDPSGHVVPGAKVVAHETTTGVNRSEQSNGVGVYSLVDLLPGTYVVTVSKPGF
jgi:archaellin